MLTIIFFFLLFIVIHLLTKPYGVANNTFAINPFRASWQYKFTWLALIIFFAFRGLTVLNDTNHYYVAQLNLIKDPKFESNGIFHIDFNSIWEPAFQIYQNIVANIWTEPYSLIFLSAIIVISVIMYYTQKNTKYVALTVFLFLVFGNLLDQISAMRQGLAFCVFLLSIPFIEKKRHICVILSILLAMQFHASAVVLYIFYLATFLSVRKSNIIKAVSALIVVFIFLYPLLDLLGRADNMYMKYQLSREATPLAAILTSVINVILLLVCYVLTKKYSLNYQNRIFVWGTILNVILSILTIKMLILSRFTIYFSIFQIIYLVNCLYKIPPRLRQNILLLLIIIGLLKTFIILEYRNEWYHLIPYSFFEYWGDPKIIDTGY